MKWKWEREWRNPKQAKWASLLLPVVTLILWCCENSAITAFLLCLLFWILLMVFTA